MSTQLKAGDKLPDFKLTDIDGREVSNESLKNKNTLIIFFRFAGCPICAATMLPYTDSLKDVDTMNIVYVYTSKVESCKTLQEAVPFPEKFQVISDKSKTLYSLLGLDNRSPLAMIKTIFKFMPKLSKINKELKEAGTFVDVGKLPVSDGDKMICPGDFLIDESGTIVAAHYGKTYNDHISLDEIKAFIPKQSPKTDSGEQLHAA